MPRSLARERAEAAHAAPARTAAIHAALTAHLPADHHLLVGYPAILNFLALLGIRRPNGCRLSRTMVTRWRSSHAFPIAPGFHAASGRRYHAPAFTSTHAVVAWLIGHTYLDHRLFSLAHTLQLPQADSAPAGSAAQHRAA